MKDRIRFEDALKHIYACLEEKKFITLEGLAGFLSISREEASALMRTLETQDWIRVAKEGVQLTDLGKSYALQVIRAHRLYETYLAQETGMEEILWHREAEIAEHRLSKEEVDQLAERLGHPKFDPHGDPIPSEGGQIEPLEGQCILECEAGWQGRVVHVEDEPESIYAKLAEEGIAPDLRIKIWENGEHILKIQAEGRVIEISKQAAMNILVAKIKRESSKVLEARRLSELKKGNKAKIFQLSAACRGKERQRLLDLGFVPGASVELELSGPFEDPSAYRIKGTLVALRKKQAELILLEK